GEAMVDCYTAAMRILKVRFNSEVELRRKLRSRRFEGADIDATIERLRAEKWLDDQRFAGAFVRTRSNKRVGKLRIRRELQAAGVSADDAKRALSENVDPEKEQEGLVALCAKRMRNLARKHGPDYVKTETGQSALVGYLVAQGYDSTLVREVVREHAG
ncbi:MAG: regulatory protein RecX, partial [Acidobacteriota bacterium]